jgi:outer membrane protein TolC
MLITNVGLYYGYSAAFSRNAGTQDGFINVELSERRQQTSQFYAKKLREALPERFPETGFAIGLGGLLETALNQGLEAPLDIQISSTNPALSRDVAAELLPEIKKIRGAVDVRVLQRLDAPVLRIDMDRQKVSDLGLTPDLVVKNLVSAVSNSSTYKQNIWIDPATGIDYLLGVQFPESKVRSEKDIREIPITGPDQDRSVPLGTLVSIKKATGATEINHQNLQPVTDILLDAQDRDIGGVGKDLAALIARTPLPNGINVNVKGEYAEILGSVSSLGWGFLLAAVLVYLLLTIQFRSFLMPAIVMTNVPKGIVGVIITLALTGTYFSIQAAIGCIFVIGVSVSHSVLLLEFILVNVKKKGNTDEAIVEASMARLRPILMTSLASILGLAPMAFGLGRGSEANMPLGRAVIGGQILSTLLNFYLLPCLYRQISKRSAGVNILAFPGRGRGKVAAFLLFPLLTFAPEVRGEGSNSTLAETVRLAVLHSPEISAAELGELKAQSLVKANQAGYLPSLEAEAVDSTGFAGSSAGLGLLGIPASPFREGPAAGLVLEQTLLDFGRTANKVRSAEKERAANAAQIGVSKFQVTLAAIDSFVACSLYRSETEFWRAMREETNQIRAEVITYVQTGQRSVVESKLAENQFEEAAAAEDSSREKLRFSLERIALLTGAPAGPPCPPLPGPEESTPVLTREWGEDPRVEKAAADFSLASARFEEKKSDFLPKVVGLASAGMLSETRLIGKENFAAVVGISFPLFDGFRTTHEVEAAGVEQNQRERELDAAREQAALLDNRIGSRAESARQRLIHLKRELVSSRQGYTLAKRRYREFKGNLLELREALRDLERTQSELDIETADFFSASVSRRLVGRMGP